MLKKFLSIIILIFGIFCIFSGIGYAVEANTADVKTTGPHWQKKPITVYVPDDPYASLVKQAFNTWQSETAGKISFSYVGKKPADIEVTFSENASSAESPIASYSVQISDKNITKGELSLASKGNAIQTYSRSYIYTTLLHEIAHLIGLSHASRKPTSIRYHEIHEGQKILKIDIMDLYYTYGWSWMDRRINK